MNLPVYNTLETDGHYRHKLEKHIQKLTGAIDIVHGSLTAFATHPDVHPLGLQAGTGGEIGGNAWQGFRSYIDDISSRDGYDDVVSAAMDKMEQAKDAYNVIANKQSGQRARGTKRKQTDVEYGQSLVDALNVYRESVKVLNKTYTDNPALDVQENDSKREKGI